MERKSCSSGKSCASTTCITTPKKEADVKKEAVDDIAKGTTTCGTGNVAVISAEAAEVEDNVVVKEDEPAKVNVRCCGGCGGSFK
ncbi:hypothetical protein LOK49_LG03G03533 [Camellia lanceoleosa]|uniref:Uncharacterized protein n=1 Tax=Camellia lanceoleosa TaxID=1840588 RepID=A0ACC0I6F7_9ERIC|nr:hypothetical protein LOK49_LG03G03533 [Camellia lanceoleosa]